MRIIANYKDFVETAKRSSLIDPDTFNALIRETYRTSLPSISTAEDLKPLIVKLMESGLLSLWQCEMILQGKHKGYSIEGFTLIDFLGHHEENNEMLFLARHHERLDEDCIVSFSREGMKESMRYHLREAKNVSIIGRRPRSRYLSEWPTE